MSDAAAARREARRRRILENSSDRLQRIAGKNAMPASTITERSYEESSVPETFDTHNLITELNEPCFTNDLSSSHSLLQAPVIQEHPVQTNLAAPQLTYFLSGLTTLQSSGGVQTPPPTLFEWVCNTKLDVILLSLLVQVFYDTLGLLQNILLPIVIHEITKVWFSRRQEGGMMSAVLLMNGISPDNVKQILHMVNSLKTIVQDLCIYLFVTVCLQSLYHALINAKPQFHINI